jgi:hypothetical protein
LQNLLQESAEGKSELGVQQDELGDVEDENEELQVKCNKTIFFLNDFFLFESITYCIYIII